MEIKRFMQTVDTADTADTLSKTYSLTHLLGQGYVLRALTV